LPYWILEGYIPLTFSSSCAATLVQTKGTEKLPRILPLRPRNPLKYSIWQTFLAVNSDRQFRTVLFLLKLRSRVSPFVLQRFITVDILLWKWRKPCTG
jgi:hypothetical protein